MSASIPNTSSSIPSESIQSSSNLPPTSSSAPIDHASLAASGASCPYHSSSSPCALLTWKDPIKTGKVFGSIVVGLIVFKTVNLFNIFFHLAYIGLLLSAAAEYSGKLVTGKGFLSNYKASQKSYAKKFNDEVLPELAQKINKIVYAHDIEATLKAAGLSYILFKLTSWLSLYTLIFAAVVLIFTVPFIYTTYKKEIDAVVSDITKIVKSKTNEYTEAAHKAAAPHIDTLIQKTGPVGNFIKSKIPVRTAGSTVGDSRATSYGTDADKKVYSASATTPSSSEPTAAAHSTGASQFPNVPTSGLHPTTVEDVVNDVKTESSNFADANQHAF
ncbi:RTN1 Reticulon-like protein 1 [Candida maltosa Xu316]